MCICVCAYISLHVLKFLTSVNKSHRNRCFQNKLGLQQKTILGNNLFIETLTIIQQTAVLKFTHKVYPIVMSYKKSIFLVYWLTGLKAECIYI